MSSGIRRDEPKAGKGKTKRPPAPSGCDTGHIQLLQEENRRLLSIFDGINESIYVSDPDTYEILFINKALQRVLGKNPVGGLCYREFQGLDAPCEFCTNEVLRRIKPETHIWEHHNEAINRTFALHDRMFKWPDGRDVRMELAVDITERKRAENALRESEENLRVTLDSIGDAVISTDTEGLVVRMNPAAERLTGWKFSEAKGRPLEKVFVIINSDTRKNVPSPVEKVIATGGVVGLANHTVLKSRNGAEYQIADSGAPIRDDNGDIIGVVLVFRDVTSEYSMQEKLIHAQKLEALGMLVGGIAHDFNNLLVGVYGYIDLARSASESPEVEDCLNSAMKSLERARSLTSQMLTFAKGGVPHRKTEYLFPFLKEVAQFVLSGSKISCRCRVPVDLYPCMCDRNQIEQVICNIVINAQQSMPEGGMINIGAENCRVEEGNTLNLAPGNYVKISVSDHGTGIKPEIASRIFDPFFSTRIKGQGLGLATAYSIIRRHEGAIDFESNVGKGSTFHVYLPADDSYSSPTASQSLSGVGRILLLDDEALVLDALSAMLKSLGYEPVRAKDGKEAIDIFNRELKAGRTFAAMIFDLTVPGGMGGRETIAHIRKKLPQIPVFVASGYADDPVLADPAAYGFTACIRKPFSISELARMLDSFASRNL